MRKKNGFTLVELLAVIVVLAIIMILTIPSVLGTVNTARKKTFAMYVDKVLTNVQEQYMYDANGGSIKGAGWYVYSIKTDLGLPTTGSYDGYVTVNATDVDNPKYIIELFDNNYMLNYYNITDFGMPDADSERILPYDKDAVKTNPYAACQAAQGNAGQSCYTKDGYLIPAI